MTSCTILCHVIAVAMPVIDYIELRKQQRRYYALLNGAQRGLKAPPLQLVSSLFNLHSKLYNYKARLLRLFENIANFNHWEYHVHFANETSCMYN